MIEYLGIAQVLCCRSILFWKCIVARIPDHLCLQNTCKEKLSLPTTDTTFINCTNTKIMVIIIIITNNCML